MSLHIAAMCLLAFLIPRALAVVGPRLGGCAVAEHLGMVLSRSDARAGLLHWPRADENNPPHRCTLRLECKRQSRLLAPQASAANTPGSRSFPTFTLTHLERCEDRAFISARSALCPAQADALAQRSMSSRDIVIAVDCDEIHDALLAELRDRGFL